MAHRKADDFAFMEDRLPYMHIGCVSADKSAVGIVGNTDVAIFVFVERLNDVAVIHTDKPRDAKFGRRCECGRPVSSGRS